jgi:DNA invertase Pin-like site-specific DNA recombinase
MTIRSRISRNPAVIDPSEAGDARKFVAWLRDRGVKPVEIAKTTGITATAVSRWFGWGGVPGKQSYAKLKKSAYYKEFMGGEL